ncbi:tripartite tricarboxylate transporter permease [archaeon]|nr:tripartite tricarboxylate transporter permease [archaeon]
MFEIIIFILLGIFTGTITGLIPGIHTNLIAILTLSSLPFLQDFPVLNLIVFLVAMAMTHTFVDFIPSIYFGAPDEDTAISVLPGHKLFIKGEAHKAIQYTTFGSIIAVCSLIFIIPLSFFFLPTVYPFITRMMSWILIWISFFLLYNEKEKKTLSLIFFILAGFLGLSTLNTNLSQPLLPLLSGLFGSSTLIHSINSNRESNPQIIEKLKITKKDFLKPSIITSIVSPFCSFLPGLGSSQAAVIGLSFSKKTTNEQFLILTGSINTLVVAFSFFTLYLISKTRTGIANAISQITTLSFTMLLWIFLTIIISSIFATIITLNLSKSLAKNFDKINYKKMSFFILTLLTSIIIGLTGFLGLFIFITSTILGLACINYNIKRSFLMGCLLIPSILYYLPFF